MDARAIVSAVALAVFFFTLLTTLFVMGRRQSHADESWEALLARLVPVDRERIEWIAGGLGANRRNGTEATPPPIPEPSEIYGLIGGLRGLEALEANCAVLIELATYVQRQYPEALVVAEQLRLNAREIQWSVGRLHAAAERGHLDSTFPDYAQRAIATYYEMTRCVVALYQASNLSELWDLQRAV